MEMASSKPRRSYQIDAVLLVTSTVLGLLMTKECLRGWDLAASVFGRDGRGPEGFRRWAFSSVSLFVCWTLVLPLVHFCSTRRGRLGRLARTPGFVPSGVVAALSGFVLLRLVIERLKSHGTIDFTAPFVGLITSFPSNLLDVTRTAGFAVAATWLVLGLGGWWRPEAHWADRAGRLLGVYWIAIYGVQVYYGIAS